MEILNAKDITKVFPGVVALNRVNLSLESGTVHCICGENGAGKSTLIKCLTGVYIPEEGEITINGKNVKEDRRLFNKVAYVPQEIDLFTHLTVAENLFMPFFKSNIKGGISQKALQKKAKEVLSKFNLNVDPSLLVNNISVSERQLLQIARATTYADYEVLMLDEPTTSLTTADTRRLFEIVNQLRSEGKCIVFISHKLEEVFEIGDIITIFKNGEKTATVKASETNITETVTRMTGREIDEDESFCSDKVSDEIVLQVKNLKGDMFKNINFELKKGEILGFAGLVGAGRSELMQAILGYLPVYAGDIQVHGKEWKKGDTSYSIQHGLFYLPEERRSQGILGDLSVRENVTVCYLKKVSTAFGISKKKEKEMSQEAIDNYDIKTPSMEKHIKFLSGGNQQKAIIGRAMMEKPEIIIFDEPTKGIDVGTKIEIYRLMKQVAEEQGVSVILISSELNELLKCSNRIISLHSGEMVKEHNRDFNQSEILSSILGLTD